MKLFRGTNTTFAIILSLFAADALASYSYDVSFKGYHNKFFVNEKDGGKGQTVNADRTSIGAWEKMTLSSVTPECPKNGTKVSIRSGNDFYWSATPDGKLNVDKREMRTWETFTLINHTSKSRCIQNNDLISLKSHHGRYVIAERDGRANADETTIDSWERFRIIIRPGSITEQEITNRKERYRSAILAKYNLTGDLTGGHGGDPYFDTYFLPIFAKEGALLPEELVEKISRLIINEDRSATSISDFYIVPAIRTLFLMERVTTSDAVLVDNYQRARETILNSLLKKQYWYDIDARFSDDVNPEVERENIYYTENHAISWSSSEYLVAQMLGRPVSDELYKRIMAFLDVRLAYGFSEYGSPLYDGVTLTPLLNLADFADDEVISYKAALVAQKLIEINSYFTSDTGFFAPATARGKNNIMAFFQPAVLYWVAQGKGESHVFDEDGLVVTCRSYCNDDIKGVSGIVTTDVGFSHAASASNRRDYTKNFVFNYSVNERKRIYSALSQQERIRMQAADKVLVGDGAFYETLHWLTEDLFRLNAGLVGTIFDVINYVLNKVGIFADMFDSRVEGLAETLLGGVSDQSTPVTVYKNRDVVLSSLQEHNAGRIGAQHQPWVANIDDISVWTQSGADSDFDISKTKWALSFLMGSDKSYQQAQMPRIKQHDNVALISYLNNVRRPFHRLFLHLSDAKNITLYWPESRFDEAVSLPSTGCGDWLVGRRNDSYVGVMRSGDQTVIGGGVGTDSLGEAVYTLEEGAAQHEFPTDSQPRQTWAVIVGHQATHGSFENFKSIIGQSRCNTATLRFVQRSGWFGFSYWVPQLGYSQELEIDGKKILTSWDFFDISYDKSGNVVSRSEETLVDDNFIRENGGFVDPQTGDLFY